MGSRQDAPPLPLNSKVQLWYIDNGRTFCVCQAFFPDRSAWEKLGKALKGYVDPEKLEMLSGTTSLPFAPGQHKCAAVKVIDHRGNEATLVKPLCAEMRTSAAE